MSAAATKLARKRALAKAATPVALPLLADLRGMILQARESVARTVDAGLTALYWHIGRRMLQDVLKHKRADYGERIVSATGRQLEREFGRGYSEKSLRHMIRFAEAFPDERIVSALRRQLTWTLFASTSMRSHADSPEIPHARIHQN